jgi:hypothetical protein
MAGARVCGSILVTIALWTMWLALLVLLVFQGYIASVNEMPIPRFLLHAIENHLAESGVTVKFGRATFDPSGRVLLQKAQFRLASFSEPVVTADAIYLRLDPWALLAQRFEASEIRATGANLYVPAMLSSSGRPEKIVQDLDAGFSIASRGDEFSVDYLNCRLGAVSVSAHGTINAGTIARNGAQAAPTSLPLAEFISMNYVNLSREFSRMEEQTAGLDHAVITAVLIPSDTRGAIVNAELFADGMHLTAPVAIEAGRLRAASRFPLLGGAPLMTSAVATAESLRISGRVSATGVRARIRGILKVDTLEFNPRQMDLTAGSVLVDGSSLGTPLVRVGHWMGRKLDAEASAELFGLPVGAHGTVDLAAKSADISFDGSFSPKLLEPISERTGVKLRRFADLAEPVDAVGRVSFAPGWKFTDASAHADVRKFIAYHVGFDEARGNVTFDGTRLKVTDGYGRSGENFVRGSYEQNFSNQDFRYLLTGRLKPLEISAWFGGDWWNNIFKNFAFPTAPPDANIEVKGRYSRARKFLVFGYAAAPNPILLGVPFDSVRTLIYVDQFGCDGLEVAVTKGGGNAKGSFKLETEPVQGTWKGLDIEANSAIDPVPLGPMIPLEGAQAIAVFAFDKPPALTLQGHFDGPASPGDRHKSFHMVLRSDTALQIHGVAFDRASFALDLADDNIDVTNIDAGFAGGNVTAKASVTGEDAARRLSFKASLTGASLGQAAAAASGYVASGKASQSTAMETFAKDKSGVGLDLNASAVGRPGELGTFVGEGNLQIQGAKLGELSLLGGLSKVLKFPELRFTQARASFNLENSSINFNDLSVTGANSKIQAKGTYAIDRRNLDFSVTIYPFMESESLLQIFNAISAPISAIFRVRLTGSIDKPSWHLAYSPLNIFRVGDTKAGTPDKSSPLTPLANPSP